MKDQVVVITGASRGIGRATALEMARRGARILLSARNGAQLEEVAREVRSAGGEAWTVVCDVTKREDVRRLFQECDGRFGRLDVLFNNAGTGQFVSVAQTTDEIWNAAMDVNLTGTFLCVRESLSLFEKTGGGLIINNASIAAVRGFSSFAAYCASKAGVLGLSRALREELREKKIRVAVILTGATDTPFWDHVAGDWNRSLMIRPEEVAQSVTLIASMPREALIEEITLMPAAGAL